jgi:hypothetical protein
MRIIGKYTLSEIATLAEADVENIRHYHQCLVAAGYVRQVGTKKQEGRPGTDKIFRLVKNTGPKPPIQKDLRFIFDPNNGEYWSEDPERAALLSVIPAQAGIQGKAVAGAMVVAGMIERTGKMPQMTGITGKIDLKKPLRLLCPRRKISPTPSLTKRGSHESPPLEKGSKGGFDGGTHVD